MTSYVIGYDLHKPGQEYEDLFDAIKGYGTWWHNLDSTWLIVTNDSRTDVRDNLAEHIDSGDKLLVADLSGGAAWTGLSDEAEEWIHDHL